MSTQDISLLENELRSLEWKKNQLESNYSAKTRELLDAGERNKTNGPVLLTLIRESVAGKATFEREIEIVNRSITETKRKIENAK